ncbi:hypothetical protein [Polyangium fumosum]|uniref:Uncharacterized protein n=1 Tax=Polyangium fumosum TaxID=889272 RepID=A0A4U1IIL5_9BACT|nr:hypothetical protein [Polyangium fumosum]TKC93709.1 hypothetical protein E8A74_49035 [Polyangium fumosum]
MIVALLANLDDIRNSKEAKDHWWLLPVGLIAVGYMLRKRRHAYAGAVVAVGGALLALAYTAQQKAEKAKSGDTKGVDTAAPDGVHALPVEAQRGVWLQLPNGQYVRVPINPRRAPAQRNA